jgi:cholesterol transport system auxiliary component
MTGAFPRMVEESFRPSRAGRRATAALALLIAAAAAGCSSSAPQTYDLSAATVASFRPLRAPVAVREPVATLDLDTQRVLVRTGPGMLAYLSGAQWSDRLPTLVQTRLIETFQNANLFQSVSRASSNLAAQYDLQLDIRDFELDAQSRKGVVDIAVKIVTAGGGRVVAAQIFRSEAPADGTSGPAATAALDRALNDVMAKIVAFTAAKV